MKDKLLFVVMIVVMVTMLVAVPLFASACEEEVTPPSEEEEEEEGPPETPAEITIALSGSISSLEATYYTSNIPVLRNIFESLVQWDANAELAPALATSWTTTSDGKMIEMQLRQGVEFSSGDLFTAKDIIFTFDRFTENNPGLASIFQKGYDRAEIVGDYTIRFYFTKFDAQFLPTVNNFFIMSKDYYDRVGEDEFVENPVGTGPYKISDWKIDEYADLVVNENYWGEEPQIQRGHFVCAPEASTRVAMLQAGEVDMIQDAPWNMVPVLQDAGFSRTDISLSQAVCLYFQLFNPNTPWAKLEVRQAINYAIDKDALIEDLFAGVPQKAESWQEPWEPGYDPTLQPVYPYDIDMAKELMEEAGYEDGFTMPLYYITSFSWARDLVEYVTNSLEQINIHCEVTGYAMGPESQAFSRELHGDTTAEAAWLGAQAFPGNPSPLIALIYAFSLNLSDSTMYGRPELDDIIEQATMTVDDTERAALINEAFKMIDADLPSIMLFLNMACYVYNSNIEYIPSVGPLQGWHFNPTNLKDLRIE